MRMLARALIVMRVDRLALAVVARVLRRRSIGSMASLGWHLCHEMKPSRAVLCARIRTGGRVFVNVREFAHRHIYLYGDYEEPVSAFVSRIATQGWVFFDIGANVGFFSVLACDVGGRDARAVAFEPQPAIADLLCGARPKAGGQITIVHAAVGSTPGRAVLTIRNDERNSGRATICDGRAGAKTDVEAITLDRYAQSTGLVPNVIKIDIEGAELDALHGATELLKQLTLRAVLCEVGADRSADEVLALMADAGFSPYRLRADGTLTPFGGAPRFENLCFMRWSDAERLMQRGRASDHADQARGAITP